MNRMKGEVCYGGLAAKVFSRDRKGVEDERSWAYRLGSTDIFCAMDVDNLWGEGFANNRSYRSTLNEATGAL